MITICLWNCNNIEWGWGRVWEQGIGCSDFLFGIAYIMIDGVWGCRDFLFRIAYVRIDGVQGGRDFLFGTACMG